MEAALSHYFGLTALIGMAYCYILATRIKLVDALFGGLDKAYVFHKWLGLGSLAVIFLHDQIDAEIKSLGSPMFANIAEDLGGLGFDGLQILLLITVITLIPYALWKFTHKFIGIFFILSSLHFIWMPKPFDLSSPLGLYMLAFCALGTLSYGYTLTSGFARTSRKHNPFKGTQPYEVIAIEQKGEVMSIELAPKGKSIKHKAGQFAFVSFDHPKLKESHPFTISQAPNAEGRIRFSIKALGDYTQTLPQYLQLGMTAHISKGFGHFGKHLGKRHAVWVAGGIGITPFVAMAQALSKQARVQTPTHLFYCVQSEAQAVHLEELKAFTKQCSHFHLHVCDSSQGQRITLKHIKETLDFDLKQATISFCGPNGLRQLLQAWMRSEGVPSRRFHYDVFEIRSGIGINKILEYALNLLLQRFPQIKQVWRKLPFISH